MMFKKGSEPFSWVGGLVAIVLIIFVAFFMANALRIAGGKGSEVSVKIGEIENSQLKQRVGAYILSSDFNGSNKTNLLREAYNGRFFVRNPHAIKLSNYDFYLIGDFYEKFDYDFMRNGFFVVNGQYPHVIFWEATKK